MVYPENLISSGNQRLTEMCGLRAGLKSLHETGYTESTNLPYPPKNWNKADTIDKGKFASNYSNIHADAQWYGCKAPENHKQSLKDSLATKSKSRTDQEDYERNSQLLRDYISSNVIKEDRLLQLKNICDIFEARKVYVMDKQEALDDGKALFIDRKSRDEVMLELSAANINNWNEDPWSELEKAACQDLTKGGKVEETAVMLKRAQSLVGMSFLCGRYMSQGVKKINKAGERIVLSSLILGQEQIRVGYNQYWVTFCQNLRLVTYRAMIGSYARGVAEEGDHSLSEVFHAGFALPAPLGEVCWRRVRDSYEEYMPKELGNTIKEKMGQARSGFRYPERPSEALEEMKAWCDVTTYDWYALCGPKVEEISVHAVGALMLGYECEVLVDMCPDTTYEEYIGFVAKGVDVIPHMDSKELAAGAFSAHACGVEGFDGLQWLSEAIYKHNKAGKSSWAPRLIDGAAYLMFLGINEGCRQPSIEYGRLRLKSELNVMAGHEIGGLFRHGMEDDVMSRGMLDEEANTVSFSKIVDKLACDAVAIAEEMGSPHSTGFLLTSLGYLLFNLVGTSSMIRWAAGVKPRCGSIAVCKNETNSIQKKPLHPQQLSRDMQKVSALAAHRASRIGISNTYAKDNPHREEDCVCWDCIAGPLPKCPNCGC